MNRKRSRVPWWVKWTVGLLVALWLVAAIVVGNCVVYVMSKPTSLLNVALVVGSGILLAGVGGWAGDRLVFWLAVRLAQRYHNREE